MGESGSAVPVLGCDTIVSLGGATSSGATIFAKNSDRPPGECQPLVLLERAEHPPDARVRCQYVEIPQVASTARVLGSRPVWLWGFEHGVNEHGLAIGNETIFAREAPAAIGLLGMDLVRLGLERASSAAMAVDVIAALVEEHGQGGSGFREFEFPYNSSFLIADAREAWILEAVGHHWAARRARTTDSISNHITIGADWERLSPRVEEHAREIALPLAEPFSFEGSYRDVENVPRAFSEGRLRCSRTRLEAGRGAHDVASLREILRDHDASGRRFRPGATSDQEQYFTICMHEGPSRTTASIVAPLELGRRGPNVVWASFGRPCASLFFPVVLAGRFPEAFTRGSDEPRADVLWWTFEQIGCAVERRPELSDSVREAFDPLETTLLAEGEAARVELDAMTDTAAERFATELLVGVAARVQEAARALLARL
ncbi:MAG: hypothetical protein FJ144_12835 [Deltaproteobacteria bacterium]|nr:hypothetical protein [Deltaproteobacteria bacterium]